jgi:hypothetical protein
MQRIAKQVLRQLKARGWTDGEVVTLRKGVFGIDITATDGERCHFATVDDVRLKVRLLDEAPPRATESPR